VHRYLWAKVPHKLAFEKESYFVGLFESYFVGLFWHSYFVGIFCQKRDQCTGLICKRVLLCGALVAQVFSM